MAHVFKRGDGKKWMMQIIDRDGQQKQKTSGTTIKKTAEEMARAWESKEAEYRKGLIDPTQERLAAERQRPIAEHVADFEKYLGHDDSPKHVVQTMRQVRWIIAACNARVIGDLTAAAVKDAIASRRLKAKDGETPQSVGLTTRNNYLTAIKSFTNWLWKHKRSADDPLNALEVNRDAEVRDRRHVRREMTPDEMAWLLTNTETYTREEHRMPGPDRAMAYRMALCTGFRVSELRRLTPASFDFGSDPPTISVLGKDGHIRPQPIHPDEAAIIRRWLTGREGKVFSKLPGNTARMMRADLKSARGSMD